jgi:hypothetical protein
MCLSGFQIRPVSGPIIAELGGGVKRPALNRFETRPKRWGTSRPTILDGFEASGLGSIRAPKANRKNIYRKLFHVTFEGARTS